MMNIPFFDLKAQNLYLHNELLKKLDSVFKSGHFILGPNVKEFESVLAKFCGAKYSIGVASGSDALLLSLMAAGVSQGDEVITTPFTFFATASAVSRLGAKPVFVDIDPVTFNIRPELVEKAVTKKTKAVIPVHLFGLCADMNGLNAIAKKHGLKVIEDAAQSIGAMLHGQKAGSMSDMCAFSFFPTKNLGGAGDGGAITTSNDCLYELIMKLRVHGSKEKYLHEYIGINSRLDELQAAVLSVKISYLENWTQKRRKLAARYIEALKDFNDITLPFEPDGYTHVYNQFTIRTKQRSELAEYLGKGGIGTAVYYPIPLHLQPCFEYLGYKKGALPETEKAAKEVLSLPIFPELTRDMQEYIIEKILYWQFGSESL